MITDAQRKLIHLARRRLELTEEDYRALLQRVAGVASSNDLDGDAGVNAVMQEFGRLGFKTVQQAPKYGERWGWATQKQLDLIRSLWRKYAGTEEEAGLERFLEKQFKVTSLRFLDFRTAQKVITTFKRMAEWRDDHPRSRKTRSIEKGTKS
jgi:phage gp16-like protein